jgi:TPP-dependent pyruvate/acetoin dehydrogenase alpha subunit
MKLEKAFYIEMLRQMLTIRAFEEAVIDLFARGFTRGPTHLYIGEEAIAVGVCMNLNKDDWIASTHRGHGHCIAKGGDITLMFAELLGKKEGYCKGKGGSMHIASVDLGILGAMGIVGSGIPIAVGAALASKLQRSNQVVVCFFGDGASNQGTFHEGLNFAGLHKLPIVFVCENNLYGISVSQKRHQAIRDIAERATGYGMQGIVVDGNDVLAVYESAQKCIKRARDGEGPTLMECKTYRWRGHFEGDPDQGIRYRAKEEIEQWKKKCPILNYKKVLLKKLIADKNRIQNIEEEVEKKITQSVEEAKRFEFPEVTEALNDVYSN